MASSNVAPKAYDWKKLKNACLLLLCYFDTLMHSVFRSRSFVDFAKRSVGSCLSTFSRSFSSETTGPIHSNWICSLQAKWERKLIFSPGHMTNMATMHIYGKNLNNSFPEPQR